MEKNKPLTLGWLNPDSGEVNYAGVGFYHERSGEYSLRIDEEPLEKDYFLKATESNDEKTLYRMELSIKNRNGKFLRRQLVGVGEAGTSTNGNVHVNYGSKYKTLILYTGEEV